MSLLAADQEGHTGRQHLGWEVWRPTLVAAILSAGAVILLIVAFESVSAFERPVALASLSSSSL